MLEYKLNSAVDVKSEKLCFDKNEFLKVTSATSVVIG